MPTLSRGAVLTAIARYFPQEDLQVVMDVLDAYGVEPYERERERVQLAVLDLSSGDVDDLLHYVNEAKKDYRNVLWWANSSPDSACDSENVS